MSTTTIEPTATRTQGRAAGALLIGVAAAAGIATVGMSGVVAGDPIATAAALAEGRPHLGMAVLGFMTAFLLDVPVAVLFYVLLRAVHPAVAATAAALRAVYAAGALALLVVLVAPAALPGAGGVPGLEAASLALYGNAFTVLLAVFGTHLVLLGWLLWRSGELPRWLAALVCLGGAAYVVHTVVLLLAPSVEPTVAPALALLAFGELVLAIWLVVRGLRPRTASLRH
jgi:hypothetical protein